MPTEKNSPTVPWTALVLGGIVAGLAAPRLWPMARRSGHRVFGVKFSTPATPGIRPNPDPARGRPA